MTKRNTSSNRHIALSSGARLSRQRKKGSSDRRENIQFVMCKGGAVMDALAGRRALTLQCVPAARVYVEAYS